MASQVHILPTQDIKKTPPPKDSVVFKVHHGIKKQSEDLDSGKTYTKESPSSDSLDLATGQSTGKRQHQAFGLTIIDDSNEGLTFQ